MSALIISNTPPFGAMTNGAVADLHALNDAVARLSAAVATAASGFDGTPGTEYETDSNFGVLPDATEPGKSGTDYAYAVNQLQSAWDTFWTAAKPSIEQLDNGVQAI